MIRIRSYYNHNKGPILSPEAGGFLIRPHAKWLPNRAVQCPTWIYAHHVIQDPVDFNLVSESRVHRAILLEFELWEWLTRRFLDEPIVIWQSGASLLGGREALREHIRWWLASPEALKKRKEELIKKYGLWDAPRASGLLWSFPLGTKAH